MKFLDQKEQVIDLQLTQYGKALLSVGAFKPVYYAFGDDDVLYDSDYTSASYGENQSDIESRIQEETPRLSVQANYVSAEKWVKKGANMPIKAVHEPDPPRDDPSTPLIGDQKQKVAKKRTPPEYRHQIKQDPNKHTPIKFKLGTSAPTSDKLPAWSVSFLNGELSGSTYFYTDTKEELHHIPQLEATIEYDVKTRILSNVDAVDAFPGLNTTHPDNSYISIEKDYLLLRILENNVAFTKENYDIEVYEVLNDGEQLMALSIPDDTPQDEFLFSDSLMEVGPRNAEYYVQMLVDDEIDPELMIDVVSKKVGSFYLDKDLKRIRARLGKTDTTRRDIYKSELESVEPCEDDL